MSEFVSLGALINENKVSARVLKLVQRDLLDILMLRQDEQEPLPRVCVENIVFDSEFKEVFVVDNAGCGGCVDDIHNYGVVMNAVIASLPIKQRKLSVIAQRCVNNEFRYVQDVQMALEKRISNSIYIPLIIIIAVLMAILAWVNNG